MFTACRRWRNAPTHVRYRQKVRPKSRLCRPIVERLEDRSTPSITLTGVPTWTEQGPAQETQQLYSVNNSALPPDAPVRGAVQSIAVNPNNPAQMIVGTVSGGVWRTTNANPASPGSITWTPLTDQLPSLAIGPVAYDPADATGNTFYAGTGLFSNGFDSGDSAVGLYRTTDAGATWTLLGNNAAGVNILATHRIKSLVVVGQTILVGTIDGTGIDPAESRDYRVLGGALFRSMDGGTTFSQVLPASGLPAGAVPSVIDDPNAPQTIYAAVAGTGVFRSIDGGADWTPINTGLASAAGSSDIELAIQNIGGVSTLYAGVSTGGTLNGIFSFNSGTSTWTALAAPPAGFDAGNGFAEKFQLEADPVNAGVVYIVGQGSSGIFRFNPAGAGSWVRIDDAGAQGTFPHADSRDLKFLNNNTLLEANDGGIAFMRNPTAAATSNWQSFNGNLAAHEVYSVAYDPVNGVVFAGTQDNGSPHQDAAGSLSWTDLTAGDGQSAAVDATSLGGGNIFGYSLSNNFGSFVRNEFNNANVNINAVNHAITGATNTAPIIITSPNHGLQTGDGVFTQGVQGNAAANGGWLITVLNTSQFSLDGSDGTTSGAYLGGGSWNRSSGIVNASGVAGIPVIITTFVPHRLNTGDQVLIQSLTGTYAALNNSNYYVTVIDATHFSLNGTVSDGSTAAGGFFGPSNVVMLKSAIGAANLSGLTPADRAAATGGDFIKAPFALNSVDPRLMLLGFNDVYEDADPTTANGFAGDVITDISANVDTLTGTVIALAYGGQRGGTGFSNVAFVGTTSGQLFFRGEAGAAFTDVTAQLGSTTTINSIALDPQDWRRVYVVTGNRVFFTADITNLAANPFTVIGGGANDNLARLSATLGSLAPQLRTVTVVGATPVVGGLGGAYRMLAPPAGACDDATWTKYGQGLPVEVVRDLDYDATTDTLVAGTMGRGVWTIANASATIAINGVLTVTGDAANNNMELRVDPNNGLRIQVSDGLGNTQSFDPTHFSQVSFLGLGGNDSIFIGSNGAAGAGNNLGFVTFLVAVDGGGQAGDSLITDDSGDAGGRTVTVTPTQVGSATGDTYFGDCGMLTYTGLGSLTVNASTGIDRITATPSASTTYTINGNAPPFETNPGDDLTINLAGVSNPDLVDNMGDGQWTFGNRQPVLFTSMEQLHPVLAIQGHKFLDSNANGAQDPGEPNLSGWTIQLDKNANGTVDASTVTDANGNYSFTNLAPGRLYRVREVQQAGFNQTTTNPPDFMGSTLTDTTGTADFGNVHSITAILVTGTDIGGGPEVKVYDATSRALIFDFFAYDPSFLGGVRVAAGDVNGDGVPDIITVPGPGGGPLVQVFSSKDLAVLQSFNAYDPAFRGGLFVAAGDVNHDGFTDIVTAPDLGGGPLVRVFSGKDNSNLLSFNAYDPAFLGGVRVAAGDINGDGFADIITGPGFGGGPLVRVFDGNTGAGLLSFNAYAGPIVGGIYVAVNDVNGDGTMDIVTTPGVGGGPLVNVFNGSTGTLLSSFNAYPPVTTPLPLFGSDGVWQSGLRVAAVDVNGDGKAEIITGVGPSQRPEIKIFDAVTLAQLDQFFAYDEAYLGGVFVGAGR